MSVLFCTWMSMLIGHPRRLSGKESSGQCRRCKRRRFCLGIRKIPWKRKGQPTPVLFSGESHGQRGLAGYSPWGHEESDTTEWAHMRVNTYSVSLWFKIPVISFCLFLLSSQKAQPLQDCLPCRIHLFDSASPVDHSWENSVCVISPSSLFFFSFFFWVQRKSFCQSMHTPAIVINKVSLVLPLREYHLFLEDIAMWPC